MLPTMPIFSALPLKSELRFSLALLLTLGLSGAVLIRLAGFPKATMGQAASTVIVEAYGPYRGDFAGRGGVGQAP